MTGFATLVAHDARLQYRYGIYAAYAFVVGFYVFVLTLGRSVLPDWAIGFVVYSDPAAVGFFFLGALMMLEKGEGVRAALAVSPLTAARYFASKLVTLTGIALATCVILLLVIHDAPNPALLLAAVTMTSITFIGIGVPIALKFRTVNGYLVGSSSFLTPLIAPSALALLEPMPLLLALWPPVAQFRLILIAVGFGSASPMEMALLLAIGVAAAIGASFWAIFALRAELGK